MSISARRIDLVVALLAVAATAVLLASLENLIPNRRVVTFAATAVNVLSLLFVTVRNHQLTPAKKALLFDLLERVQTFMSDLNEAILDDSLGFRKVDDRRNDLESRFLELFPQNASEKGWDGLTDAERRQAIEMSFPA